MVKIELPSDFVLPSTSPSDPYAQQFRTEDALALLRLLRSVGRENMMIAEIGSWKGGSTSILALAATQLHGKVFCIDPWMDSPSCPRQEAKSNSLSLFRANMIRLGVWGAVYPMMMDSEAASKIFADGILDLVFIDADHHYEHVKQDILGWLPRLKASGLLCGHDCEGFYSSYPVGMRRGIDKYARTTSFSHQIHPGVIKALYDCFNDEYSRMPNSWNGIWYIEKEQARRLTEHVRPSPN